MSAGSKKNGSIVLESALERRITEFAEAAGETPEEIVRKAFEAYSDARQAGDGASSTETVYDRLARAGLIGCVDDPDAPTDLSTNKKYMEGFGRD